MCVGVRVGVHLGRRYGSGIGVCHLWGSDGLHRDELGRAHLTQEIGRGQLGHLDL
jgi:hypothetical protein